jgi:hypothetical protein
VIATIAADVVPVVGFAFAAAAADWDYYTELVDCDYRSASVLIPLAYYMGRHHFLSQQQHYYCFPEHHQ